MNRVILFKKNLHSCHLSFPVFDVLKSVLRNRQLFVCIGLEISRKLLVNCGIPQRSILGSLLSLIFVIDLPKTVKIPKSFCLSRWCINFSNHQCYWQQSLLKKPRSVSDVDCQKPMETQDFQNLRYTHWRETMGSKLNGENLHTTIRTEL